MRKIFLITIIYSSLNLKAINSDSLLLILSQEYGEYIESYDPNGYIYFYENTVPEGLLATNFTQLLGLPTGHELRFLKEWKDTLTDHWYFRYHQYYQGIRLEGAELTENSYENFTYLISGKIANNIEISEVFGTSPLVDEETALGFALEHLNFDTLFWEIDSFEIEIKEKLNDSTASYFPTGELIFALNDFVLPNYFIDPNKYQLCWKFNIQSTSPKANVDIFINAINGSIYRIDDNLKRNGTAETEYYGVKNIDTEFVGGIFSHHYLHAKDGVRNIHTKYYWSNKYFDKSKEVKNHKSNGEWKTKHQHPTSIHWAATEAHDYFYTKFFRPSMDGNGSKIRVYALTTQENAYYSFDGTANEDYIYVGLLEGKNLSALDIVAHEYTHGIVRHTSNLAPNNEPGALDESFADIFGALIERYSGVPTWTDWLLGEEAQLSTTYTRNMETPNNGGYHLDANCNKIDGQPDTYAGTWWYSGSCQAGGRHVNSGVQNKWFNLLINGGTHNGVTIQNIGIDRAERIAYLTMFNLNSNAQFADARSESISQARKNYGKCSNEEIQVTNAWAAVGVGQTSTCAGSSLDEINQSFDINIYPNPVKEELQIEIIGSLPSSITIINSIGCVVMSINPLSLNSKHINVGIVDIAQGVYFLQAKGEHNETMRTIKFIKN